ncbi:MAG: hypothetical protein ACOCYT_01965 [Chloroflexota bacterium]
MLSMFVIMMLIVAACGGSGDDDAETNGSAVTATPAATSENAESTDAVTVTEPVEADETVVTDEAVVTEEPAATEEAVVPDEMEFVSSADGYYINAAYAIVNEDAHATDLGRGQHWVVAVVTLGNDTGETVTIAAEDLVLVDANGNRYAPEPGSTLSPELVGYTLAEGENIYGFAAFALPVSAEPRFVAWCPGGACDPEITSPINLR